MTVGGKGLRNDNTSLSLCSYPQDDDDEEGEGDGYYCGMIGIWRRGDGFDGKVQSRGCEALMDLVLEP